MSTSGPWAEENAFYLSTTPTRMGKLLAQYEAFKATVDIPGAIVECGVFKGASFSRLAAFRQLFGNPEAKTLIGFDTFDIYAPANSARDRDLRNAVVDSAGDRCIGTAALYESLSARGIGQNVELFPGDISQSVPTWADNYPEVRISLLNVDVDFFAAATTVLQYLWPRVAQGGIMLLDDYGRFEGETRAVDLLPAKLKIRRSPFAYSPCYVVKE
jgi:hypothetical protein